MHNFLCSENILTLNRRFSMMQRFMYMNCLPCKDLTSIFIWLNVMLIWFYFIQKRLFSVVFRYWENGHLPPCVPCHMSRVTTCHMSRVTCHLSHVACHMPKFWIFSPKKVVKLVGWGSVINGSYSSSFRYIQKF